MKPPPLQIGVKHVQHVHGETAPPLLLEGTHPSWCPKVYNRIVTFCLHRLIQEVGTLAGFSLTGTSRPMLSGCRPMTQQGPLLVKPLWVRIPTCTDYVHRLTPYFIVLGIVTDWKKARDSGAYFPGDNTDLHPECKPIVLSRQVVDRYLGLYLLK